MIGRFAAGNYWEEGQFQTRTLLIDLFNFVENVAMIYDAADQAAVGAVQTCYETQCDDIPGDHPTTAPPRWT